MKRLFSTRGGTTVRFALRAGLTCVTAFGLDLSADQVAAIQLLAEAVLQLGVLLTTDEPPE